MFVLHSIGENGGGFVVIWKEMLFWKIWVEDFEWNESLKKCEFGQKNLLLDCKEFLIFFES